MVGQKRFFKKKEVKCLLALLTILRYPNDVLSFRIITKFFGVAVQEFDRAYTTSSFCYVTELLRLLESLDKKEEFNFLSKLRQLRV